MNSKVRLSQRAYLACAWLFVAGILTQVFLIGMTFLGGQPSLPTHVGLGHGLGLLALLLVVLAYVGRLPSSMRRLTWLSFGIYILLADILVFMRGSVPLLAALHPVMAVVLFALTVSLALGAWLLVRDQAAVEIPAVNPETTGVPG